MLSKNLPRTSKNNTWLEFLRHTVSVQTYSTTSSRHFFLLKPCTPAVTGWVSTEVPKYQNASVKCHPVNKTRSFVDIISTMFISVVLNNFMKNLLMTKSKDLKSVCVKEQTSTRNNSNGRDFRSISWMSLRKPIVLRNGLKPKASMPTS